jgi:hypothetical protein
MTVTDYSLPAKKPMKRARILMMAPMLYGLCTAKKLRVMMKLGSKN